MTPGRRNVHIGTEIIAVTVIAPTLWHIATSTKDLQPASRNFLKGLSISTLVLDGWLLWEWQRNK
jgi:hypothetical protein